MNLTLLSSQIADQDALEWIGLATGIVYVCLAAIQRPVCWVFGIISSFCLAWKSFEDYKLMADGILQVFYIIIGFYGLSQWLTNSVDHKHKPVGTSSLQFHLAAIFICLLISIPSSWLLIQYAGARYGYLDTALTTLSVFATFLLVRKDLHNWIYWIVIDIVYVVLYLKSDGILFALLFLIYTVVAIWGYRQWNTSR
jgi:nicotinamide mononucleotide transporter